MLVQKEKQDSQGSIAKNPVNSSTANLLHSLSIQPPSPSQQSIEFSQMFRLPLSPTFYGIYNQVYRMTCENYFYTDFTKHATYLRDNIKLIDFRIQRWYETWDTLQENIRVIRLKIENLTKDIGSCEAALSAFSFEDKYLKKQEEYKKFEQMNVFFLHQRENFKKALSDLKNEKMKLLEEISSSGYFYEENNTSNSFAIKKLIADKSEHPVTLPENFNVENPKDWNYFIDTLTKSSAIKNISANEEKNSKFRLQLQALESRDNFIKSSTQIKKIQEEIDRANLDLKSLKASEASYYQAKDETNTSRVKKEKQKVQESIGSLQDELNNIKKTGFIKARMDFILYWNDPKNYIEKKKSDAESSVVIERDVNPLKQFHDSLKVFGDKIERKKPYSIHHFRYRNADLYNEEQQSLQDFMQLPNLDDQVIILPYFDSNGRPSTEVLQGIISPKSPTGMFVPKAPTIKFVETQEMQMGWQHYSLGELSGSFNLFPGEKKMVVVERQTKLTTKKKLDSRSEQETRRHHTSSFEDNLRNEFSSAVNMSHADEQSKSAKQDSSDITRSSAQSSNERAQQDNSSSSFDWRVKAEASYMFASVSASVGGSQNSSHATSSTDKSQQMSSKEAARVISTSEHGQSMNKHSRDTSAKNIQNSVSRVASETSSNNKVEITSTSSEECEENKTNKEMMQVSNENLSCTVNYNFYQIQNVYRTIFRIKDVKIVVNTGIEVVEGTGIYDTRVYELEEFNKIYKDSGRSRMATILCALIAHRTLKYYTNLFSSAPNNEGRLKLKLEPGQDPRGILMDLKQYVEKLSFVTLNDQSSREDNTHKSPISGMQKSEEDSRKNQLDQKISELRHTLERLSKFVFVFNEGQIVGQTEHRVNAPAFHVDTQIGLMPSVEPYIDQRRSLDTEAQVIDNRKSMLELEFMQSDPEYRKALLATKFDPRQISSAATVPMLPYYSPGNGITFFGSSTQPVTTSAPSSAPQQTQLAPGFGQAKNN